VKVDMIQKIVMLDMITKVVIEDIEIIGIDYSYHDDDEDSYHDDHDCDLELLLNYSIAIDSVDIQ
jgi:hypothetical protein